MNNTMIDAGDLLAMMISIDARMISIDAKLDRMVTVEIAGLIAIAFFVLSFVVCILSFFVYDLKRSVERLLLASPERVDFWHERRRSIAATCSRPSGLREKLMKYFGHSLAAKCAVTGASGVVHRGEKTIEKVILAHISPRNTQDLYYGPFGLDPKQDRDGKRMLMFLSENIEKAYHRKEISFRQIPSTGPKNRFEMVLWDPFVGKRLIHRFADKHETIAKYAGQQHYTGQKPWYFEFPAEKTPYTSILTCHHRACYHHAVSQGWSDESRPLEIEQ